MASAEPREVGNDAGDEISRYGDSAGTLAVLVMDRPATLSTGRLVAIDGPAGSGKSTLALRLRDELRRGGLAATVLRLDDMYEGWTGLDDSLEERVLDQVLRPLAAGRAVRWQAYDWDAGRLGDWHDLPRPDVLVLDGCGAGALAYASYTTVLVWVEAAAQQRTRRALARDGEALLENWAAWSLLEQRSFRTNRTRERADVRLVT